MDKNACPACGLARQVWPDAGMTKGGVAFCCQGCANGAVCAIRADAKSTRAPTKDEIRSDRASGDFVQSLQKERKTVSIEDYGTEAITKAPPVTGGAD